MNKVLAVLTYIMKMLNLDERIRSTKEAPRIQVLMVSSCAECWSQVNGSCYNGAEVRAIPSVDKIPEYCPLPEAPTYREWLEHLQTFGFAQRAFHERAGGKTGQKRGSHRASETEIR